MLEKETYDAGSGSLREALAGVLARRRISPVWPIGLILVATMAASGSLAAHAQIVRPPKLNLQFHRAETAFKSGNSLLEAKARIDRVLRQLPRDPEALKLRASIFLSMNRPDDALKDAREAAIIDPLDGETNLILCESATRTSMTEEAVRALHRSAENLKADTDQHLRLSRCAARLGRFDEAQSYARIALAREERDPAIYVHLARLFVLSGDSTKAKSLLRKGLGERILVKDLVLQDTLLAPLLETEQW